MPIAPMRSAATWRVWAVRTPLPATAGLPLVRIASSRCAKSVRPADISWRPGPCVIVRPAARGCWSPRLPGVRAPSADGPYCVRCSPEKPLWSVRTAAWPRICNVTSGSAITAANDLTSRRIPIKAMSNGVRRLPTARWSSVVPNPVIRSTSTRTAAPADKVRRVSAPRPVATESRA